MSWENLEQAFAELDKDEYATFANSLWTYFTALRDKGFSEKQSFTLLANYAKFLYDMAFEQFAAALQAGVHAEVDDEEYDDEDEDDEMPA